MCRATRTSRCGSSPSRPWATRSTKASSRGCGATGPTCSSTRRSGRCIALRAAGEPAPQNLVQAILACAGQGRRLPVVEGRHSRLERHRRRDRGAAGSGCRRRSDPPRARRAAHLPEPRRWLRAHEGPRVGCAVDGLGDPGAHQRRPEARQAAVPVPEQAPAGRRQLPLLGSLRDDAGLGHGAGRSGARRQAVPAALIALGGRRRAARSRIVECRR